VDRRAMFVGVGLLLMCMAALTGCAAPAGASQAAARGPALLDGVYQKDSYGGTVQIEVKGNHFSTNEIFRDGTRALLAEGNYGIKGDQILFTEQNWGPRNGCLKKDNVYTYQYSYDAANKALRLTAVSDSCSLRKQVQTDGPWAYLPKSQ
jgi:hypothetical protein